jgi:hypothetical protein
VDAFCRARRRVNELVASCQRREIAADVEPNLPEVARREARCVGREQLVGIEDPARECRVSADALGIAEETSVLIPLGGHLVPNSLVSLGRVR